MSTEHPNSPLGGPGDIARAREHYPGLAPHIDDLEDVLTPEFDRTDRAAIAAQATLKRARIIEMGGGALVAALAIVRLGVGEEAWPVALAAAVIAGVTSVAAVVARRTGLEDWLDNRRVAEELRSLYFRWLTSVDDGDHDEKQRRRRLRSEVNRVIEVEPIRIGAELTGSVDEAPTDDIHDDAWHLYRDARLRDQLEWMRSKAETVGGRSQLIGVGQTVLMAVAAVAALLSLADDPWGRVSAIVVAVTAAAVGFLAALDSVVASDRLSQHYQRTVQRLDVIDRSLNGQIGSLHDVEEIESVLMAEHRAWHRITEGNQQ